MLFITPLTSLETFEGTQFQRSSYLSLNLKIFLSNKEKKRKILKQDLIIDNPINQHKRLFVFV